MKKNPFIFGLLVIIALFVLGYFETSFLFLAGLAFILLLATFVLKFLNLRHKNNAVYKSLIIAITIFLVATLIIQPNFLSELRDDFTETVIESVMKILALFIPLYLYFAWRKYFQTRVIKQDALPPLSRAKEQHYHELGLSDSEIELFWDTMN